VNERLVAFFRGTGTDHRGRGLDAILARDDAWLESTHDFVQWLFPLREPSGVLPQAPRLDAATEAAFAADAALRDALGRAFERMLRFYGFERRDDGSIAPGPHWDARAPDWFRRSTHNDLRITRILRSLTLLGRADDARRFLAALAAERAARPDCGIGATAFAFWEDAVGRGSG